MRRCLSLPLLVLSLFAASATAREDVTRAASPPRWDPGFGLAGVNAVGSHDVRGAVAFDDGSGRKLYVVGTFHTAGSTVSHLIACWNGSRWSRVETPWSGGRLNDVAVFDGGDGSELWVAGRFVIGGTTYVAASWDGSTWMPHGVVSSPPVEGHTLLSTAEHLFLGGRFERIDGVTAQNVAAFDGTSWAPVGGGLPWRVLALEQSDAQGAPRIYAGTGSFGTDHLYRLEGGSWAPLVPGPSSSVGDLEHFASPTGPQLVVSGFSLGVVDDDGYRAFGAGAPVSVHVLESRLESGQDVLYVAGNFTQAGGQPARHVARFDGTAWSPLGSGVGSSVWLLESVDLGGGERLYAGGSFVEAGGTNAYRIAAWDGVWSPLGTGAGLLGEAAAFEVFDDGSGPALYVGGGFQRAGATTASGLARWKDGGWEPLPAPPGGGFFVAALRTWDDGSGPALYVGGSFSSSTRGLLRFDGSSWSSVGGDVFGRVNALEVWDDGSGESLFVAGDFGFVGTASSPVAAENIARWDGASWQDIGGLSGFRAEALEVFDDGSGEKLFVGGIFTAAGGAMVANLASWDGSVWSDVGGGVSGNEVRDLLAVDLLSVGGRRLVVAGDFDAAGGVPSPNGIAAWNGSGWEALPPYVANSTDALAVWDDGARGPALYAAGSVQSPSADVVVLRQSGWESLGPDGLGSVTELFPSPLGSPHPGLWAGGGLVSVGGGVAAAGLARWTRLDPSDAGTIVVGAPLAPLRLGTSRDADGGLCLRLEGAPAGAVGLLLLGSRLERSAAGKSCVAAQAMLAIRADGEPLRLGALPAGSLRAQAVVLDPATGGLLWTPATEVVAAQASRSGPSEPPSR